MKSEVTTKIMLDKRTIKKDGTYPLKIRITHDREQKYYPIKTFIKKPAEFGKLSFTVEDFNNILGKKNNTFKDYFLKMNAIEKDISDVIAEMEEFSFSSFEMKYFNEEIEKYAVFNGYDKYMNKLNELKKHGTYKTYKYSRESLRNYCIKNIKNFTKNSILKFEEVTPFFLDKYEAWMCNERCSKKTTVGIFLRNLRAIFNMAINDNIIKKEIYPFGIKKHGKYSIPSGNNIKKALSIEEIEKIFNYKTNNLAEDKAKDFWIFIYLCNGINLMDAAFLKYKNIKDDNIEWIRSKTKNTVKKEIIIEACYTQEMREIIKKWGNEDTTPNNYIFPILNDEMDSEYKYQKVNDFVKLTNKYLKKIAVNLKINKKVTTYSARHSFGTILNKNGRPLSYIASCYGHTSLETTLNYLDVANQQEKIEHISALTDFKSLDFKKESKNDDK